MRPGFNANATFVVAIDLVIAGHTIKAGETFYKLWVPNSKLQTLYDQYRVNIV